MKNSFVVKIINNTFGIEINSYIKRIISYKKGIDGVKLTIDINNAHKYSNENNASKPAQIYSGEIQLI